jgi:hypothetical protein
VKQRLAAGCWLAACLALSWPPAALGADEPLARPTSTAGADPVTTPVGEGGDAPLAGTAAEVGAQPRASVFWLSGLVAIGFVALRRRSR